MRPENNPQHQEMADESMIRCLESQAEAIWPQESALIETYGLSGGFRVLDVGCGTGQFVSRMGALYPECRIEGVDLIVDHLERARRSCVSLGDRVRFTEGDALALAHPDGSFDLTVSRHVLQSVPDARRALGEMKRVTRPGGRIHVLAEDYAMIHLHPLPEGGDEFFRNGPIASADKLGIDLRVGRKAWTYMKELGLEDLTVRYVVVDTTRTPRELFARIWTAWRDGFTGLIAEGSEYDVEQVRAHWDSQIECLRNPAGYAVWQLPVVSGRVRA